MQRQPFSYTGRTRKRGTGQAGLGFYKNIANVHRESALLSGDSGHNVTS